MRLQKFIASSGMCSRRRAEELIAAGSVQVNGITISELGTVIDPDSDSVFVDGKRLVREKPELYLFHKPNKVVTTLSDPEGRPSLADFVDTLDSRVFPVGRLDYDVTGLLLLTNSGEYAEQLQHPRYQVERTYWARVRGKISEQTVRKALDGIRLKDGPARASRFTLLAPNKQTLAHLGPPGAGQHSLIEIVVTEGRKHFVKRLLEQLGHPVLKLCRVAFGPFRLGALQPGELRRTKFRPLAEITKGAPRPSLPASRRGGTTSAGRTSKVKSRKKS